MVDYISGSINIFKYYKQLGEKAIAQVSDNMLVYEPTPGINSIAVIIRHLHGNMKSRWTDFLTSDGEKTWRNRDEEFEAFAVNRESLLQSWEEGWNYVFNALEDLKPEDLDTTIVIRHQPQTVSDAIQRQIAHYAYHVGQIVYLAKMEQGENWTSLSIPRHASGDYNRQMYLKREKDNHFTDQFLK